MRLKCNYYHRVLGEEKDDSSVQKQPDCSVFWSLDLATVQQLLRDDIIVSAAIRSRVPLYLECL